MSDDLMTNIGKKLSRGSAKGQVFTIDFVISIVLFIFVVLIVMQIWNSLSTNAGETEHAQDIYSTALSTSDLLLRNPGFPENWNSTNVSVIGLADENHVLNSSKIFSFLELEYDDTRELLGISEYKFFFSITDKDGENIILGSQELGYGEIPSGQKNSMYIKRVCILDYEGNKSIVNANVVLWE